MSKREVNQKVKPAKSPEQHDPLVEAFMRALKRHRLAKGLSLTKLARLIGVAPNTVQAWECGRNMPRADTFPKLAQVLEIDPYELTKVISPEPRMAGVA